MLSCRVFRSQIELCKNGMASQKVFSDKEKKKENENCGCLDETQKLCPKIGQFISGNKTLNYCSKRVK